jgi:Predicted membrane protein
MFYSRHPNYFGDSVFWWGISLFCFSISYNLFIFISPIVMTYLLLKVSGVSLLEKTIAKKKEGYDNYIKSTSSFIILPKKNIK